MVMFGNKVHAAALAVTLCYGSYAAASNQPHPHRGVATPFESSPPNVKLDESAESVLSIGKPYQAQVEHVSNGGKNNQVRTMLVQDVKAPVETVMDRILDFDHYSRMVPNTLESEIYRREQEHSSSSTAADDSKFPKLEPKTKRLWVRLKAGAPGLQIQFFCNVLHEPAKNMVTWTLDYNKKSDVHDSVGYWYVEPHPKNPTQWARVHYSTEISLFRWVPKFIGDVISKSALHDAVTWVKKHSELKHSVAQEQQKQLQEQQQTDQQHAMAITDHQHYFGFSRRAAATATNNGISTPVKR